MIVNRVGSAIEGKRVADRMIQIAAQFLNLKVEYLGFIYDDPLVQQSVLRQRPFMIADPKGKASVCLKHIVSRIEKTEFLETEGFGRFMRKLFGREWT
jgi:flagellar biosynthesis protein FlhG